MCMELRVKCQMPIFNKLKEVRHLCHLFGLQRSTGASVRSYSCSLCVGYAFSPIDLIPLGVVLTLNMIPEEVMTECR